MFDVRDSGQAVQCGLHRRQVSYSGLVANRLLDGLERRRAVTSWPRRRGATVVLPSSQLNMSAVMPAYQPSASSLVCSRTSAVSPTSLMKPSSFEIFSSVGS